MDKVIEWVLAQYGVSGVILLTGLIIVFKFSNPIVSYFKRLIWNDINYNNKPSKMIKYKLVYWRDFKIENIDVKDKGRRNILRDLLCIKFANINNLLIEPLLAMKVNNEMPEDIANDILSLLSESVESYENEAIERGIPEMVLSQFQELHSNSVEKFNMNCLLIMQSNGIYNTNDDKIEAIISMLIVLLELTIIDVERTLSTLNGELTGTVYKGVVCG